MTILILIIGFMSLCAFGKAFSEKNIEENRKQNNIR